MNIFNIKQVNLFYFKHIGLTNQNILLYTQVDVPILFQNITNDHITFYLLAHALIYDIS